MEKNTSNSSFFTFSYTSKIDGKCPAKNPIPLTARYDPVNEVPAMRIGFLRK